MLPIKFMIKVQMFRSECSNHSKFYDQIFDILKYKYI